MNIPPTENRRRKFFSSKAHSINPILIWLAQNALFSFLTQLDPYLTQLLLFNHLSDKLIYTVSVCLTSSYAVLDKSSVVDDEDG